MDKETELTVWAALPAEHRERLVTYTQEAAKAFKEAAEKISVTITDMFDAVVQVFIDLFPTVIEEVKQQLDSLDIAVETRKKWKPVKNTVPRYHCVQRKITPHARSCC